MAEDFFIKFWGVRGSIPTPGPGTVRYGGNTACMEIRCGAKRVIIDGGSGLRNLAPEIFANPPDVLDLYFTHTHWDHVCGVPFFGPAYSPAIKTRMHAAHLTPPQGLEEVIRALMLAPLFPVPLGALQNCEFHGFAPGDGFEPAPGFAARTLALKHPNGAVGYRFDHAGKSICVITDTEHEAGVLDQDIVRFCDGADIMVYDATYEDAEYRNHVGWGHSTWQECLKIAAAAAVKTPVLFHHDPSHDDACMDRILAEAQAVNPACLAAVEGATITP